MAFSDTDKPIILDKAAKEVEQHNGAVWTHIVSFKREVQNVWGIIHWIIMPSMSKVKCS